MSATERPDPPIDAQRAFWNAWNHQAREARPLDDMSRRRGDVVLDALRAHRVHDAAILEIGCGAGWLASQLTAFGDVTATDLADDVLARARARYPAVEFVAGDFLALRWPRAFDVAVCVETLSHVADQAALVARIHRVLKPGGLLVLTTQNRFVFTRLSSVMRQGEGQLRQWLTLRELRRLVAPWFDILRLDSIGPLGDRGILRLANSAKLNAVLGGLVEPRRIERWKEQMGWGQTLVVVGRAH